MAKSTKKTTKAAVQKKAATAESKEPVKKIAAKPESKKLTTEPEKKKIAAKPEAKKIVAAKEPEKITAKPEPKKIKTVEPVKIEAKDTKASKETKRVRTEKAPVKAAAKKEPVTVEKETVVERDVETIEKASTAKKTVAKKAPAKKAATKKVEAEKEPTKKAAAKKTSAKAKNDTYRAMDLDTCIACMQKMGVQHSYEDYKAILLDEADYAVIEKNILEGNGLTDKSFDFDNDGFDLDLIPCVLDKVADTMDIKAADFAVIKKDMKASVKTTYSKDDEKNAKEYLKEFKLAEKVLMIGQRKGIVDSQEISNIIGSDVDAFMDHFFSLAYEILPSWQYDDVKFYEDFAYAVLSQYSDLYEKYQLRILIDCADLYIKHGDFQHGDENYGYILRDNQIKDYIYYRFASIYEDIDFNKAKGIAYESMQYVDDRYTYYPNIVEIMNK